MNLDQLRNRPTISVAEVAEVFGIARSTAYRYAESGEIRIERKNDQLTIEVWRIGGRLCVPTAPLLQALADPQHAPTEESPDAAEAAGEGRSLQAVEDTGDRVA